ncbi:hypothetical protein GOBAR_AA19540 [Gossypium barbadense]|uniref:Rx N-terminal domain-containing protein n=1 Tax=Gossypium barbadense TaxID=3634 RepID=A0A2P5XCR0_GOSBA|nr:hypothetical protein GOBAR_AA19540 [Gossypium barbadense]
MAEAIAFDIAVELITKLSSFAVSQIGLWWNVKDDLDDLGTTVSTIKAVILDAEEKSMTNNLITVWLEALKDALYDADDLLDDFSTETLRKDLMGGKKLMKEVRLFFSSSNQFAYGLKIGRKIKAIKARLASIESKANTFGFMVRDRPLETSFMTKKRQQTHSFVPKDKIIGRDNDKATLQKLVLEFESEENVYIIPIVGFGGLGKTALAQFVYSDEMVKTHFELMIWVCVSDVFDVKLIVENIIESATGQAPDQHLKMEQLQIQLREKIGGKKYLLVLDDIWNEERENWVSLKELLIGGAEGSRIIVTTRSFKVAKITSKCQPYVLKGLSDFDAWSLFKEIPFEQIYADSTDSAFVEIGQQILESTIPLSIHKLKHLRYLDLSCNGGEILPKSICKIQNLQALKLDECYLLEELPKKIENLVNLTHLTCSECKSLTHMPSGIGKLTSLEELSMFVVDRDGSPDGADLSELSGLNNLRGQLRITNLRFVKNVKEKFKTPILKGKQHLGSLILEWNGDNDDDDNKLLEDLQPHPNLEELCIDGWGGDAKFPSWLSLLTNVVFINIWGPNKFKYLPSVAQLPCLQNLTIRDCSELEYMDDNSPKGSQGEPESFFPLLKYLHLKNCRNMKSWWRTTKPIDDDSNENDTTVVGTSTMAFPCLSSLWIENCPLTSMPLYPSVDDNLTLENTSSRPFKQTIKMKMNAKTPSSSTSSFPLSKLKSFQVKNMEDLDTPMLDEYLQHLTSLKRLTINGCTKVDLEGMQWEPLKNLSYLVIDNIPKLVSLPLGLQHLVELKTLKIHSCSGLRSLFPVFQHLTSLEEFSIRVCEELELSAPKFQIFQDHTSLRSLFLTSIPKCWQLPEWIQHLTNLQELHLWNFPNLTSLPDEMRCLTNLQLLKMRRVPQLVERCRKDIGADWHKIAHIPHITCYQRIADITRSRAYMVPMLLTDSWELCSRELKHAMWLSNEQQYINTNWDVNLLPLQMMMMMPNVWPFVKLALEKDRQRGCG